MTEKNALQCGAERKALRTIDGKPTEVRERCVAPKHGNLTDHQWKRIEDK